MKSSSRRCALAGTRGGTWSWWPPRVIVAVRSGRSVFTILLIDMPVRVCASRETARWCRHGREAAAPASPPGPPRPRRSGGLDQMIISGLVGAQVGRTCSEGAARRGSRTRRPHNRDDVRHPCARHSHGTRPSWRPCPTHRRKARHLCVGRGCMTHRQPDRVRTAGIAKYPPYG